MHIDTRHGPTGRTAQAAAGRAATRGVATGAHDHTMQERKAERSSGEARACGRGGRAEGRTFSVSQAGATLEKSKSLRIAGMRFTFESERNLDFREAALVL